MIVNNFKCHGRDFGERPCFVGAGSYGPEICCGGRCGKAVDLPRLEVRRRRQPATCELQGFPHVNHGNHPLLATAWMRVVPLFT